MKKNKNISELQGKNTEDNYYKGHFLIAFYDLGGMLVYLFDNPSEMACEMVGEDENACEDGNEYNGFTKPEEIASYILDQIMKCNGGDIWAEFNDELWALEPKHLRFMGKKRIEEIVNHRVAWMFKNFPPQY